MYVCMYVCMYVYMYFACNSSLPVHVQYHDGACSSPASDPACEEARFFTAERQTGGAAGRRLVQPACRTAGQALSAASPTTRFFTLTCFASARGTLTFGTEVDI